MKSLFFLSPILLIVLSSCTSYQRYVDSFLEIPLKPEKNVEVYYPGELLPHKDYLEVGGLAIREGLSRDRMMYIGRLRTMAQKSGIDALIDIRRELDENSFLEDPSYLYVATGIKYLQNIDYLDEYVREESFYSATVSTKEKELSAVIERTPAGRVLSSKFLDDDAKSVYNLYVQEYRDYHLLEEQANWSYKLDPYDKYPVLRRYTRAGGWKVKTCKFHYKEDRLNWINIYYHDQDADTKVYYTYDEEGRVIKRQLLLSHNREIKETYHYDKQDKLSHKDYEIRSTASGFFQKYVSEYQYYKKEDIHDFINP